MSVMMMQGVEQLLARSDEPLSLGRYQDELPESLLETAAMNASDSLLALDSNNPTLVKEDLELQKAYFRKIKHSYLEHYAKKDFVYSITGDEPQAVSEEENQELEAENMQRREEMKGFKAELEGMQVKSVNLARENADKQKALNPLISETAALHSLIKEMELELQRIRASHPPEGRMTTNQARDLVSRQDEEIATTMEEIDTAKKEIEVIKGEIGRGGKEVMRLGKEREKEEARAREVREGREAGDTRVDELCHWLSSSMAFYRTLLGIRTVQAISENSIQLEYDVADRGVVTLLLEYDPSTRRLVDARSLGTDVDVKEAIVLALVSNDAPGLIADILSRLRR